MKFAVLLFFVSATLSNFYLKVDKEEKCIIDSFVKNQEAIIKLSIFEFDKNPELELTVIIKDLTMGQAEVQRFTMKNEQKKFFVYTHLMTGDAIVCLTASRDLLVNFRLDVNIQLPENLIDKNDMQELENTIYQSVTSMADFNRNQKDLGLTGNKNLSVD